MFFGSSGAPSKIKGIDPDWAREHQLTLWKAGYSRGQINRLVAQPGFAAQRAVKQAEILAEKQLMAEQKAKHFAEKKAKLLAQQNAELLAYKAAAEAKTDNKDIKPTTNNHSKDIKPTTNNHSKDSKSLANANSKMDSEPKDNSKPATSDKAGTGKPNFTFTAEEDKQLLELKEKGETWKAIAQEMKKPQGEIKKRFNEIATDEQKNSGQKDGGKEKEKGADNPKGKVADRKENKDDAKCKNCGCHASKAKDSKGEKGKATATPGVPSTYIGPKSSAPTGDNEEWEISTVTEPGDEQEPTYIVLYPNDDFDEEACKVLAKAIYEDSASYFIRVASRVYDDTGKRTTPQKVQQYLNTKTKGIYYIANS